MGGCFPCVKSSVPRRKDVEMITEDPQSTNLHLRKFRHKHISYIDLYTDPHQ